MFEMHTHAGTREYIGILEVISRSSVQMYTASLRVPGCSLSAGFTLNRTKLAKQKSPFEI